MQVFIVNFGYKECRYLPMYELFIADAISKKGNHTVRIITVMNDDNHDEIISRMSRDGENFITILWESFSSKSNNYIKNSLIYARRYKKTCSQPLLVGGYWASTAGHCFKEFDIFDYIIDGFSAEQIANAIDNWEETKIHSNINATAQMDWSQYDLDMSFLEDPSKYYKLRDQLIPGYLTSLGCPNQCTFCYNSVYQDKGTSYSERSIEKIRQDIEILKKEYNFLTIQFKDLNFFYNTKRAFEILDFLQSKDKKVRHALDITVKDATEEIFQKAAKYGIKEMWIGLESFNPNSLDRMRKLYSREKLEKVFSWADKYKITVYGNIMLGSPWQNRKYVEDTILTALEYTQQYKYLMITFNALRPVLGTPIQKEYYHDLNDKVDFDEMIDAFSFYLDGKQDRIYGVKYDFIDFEKVHNAFWYINILRVWRNRSNRLFGNILHVFEKIIKYQLRPPYFRSKLFHPFFLIRQSTKDKLSCIGRALLGRFV